MRTDGEIAVVELKDCQPANPQLDSSSTGGKFRPGNHAFRYIRRQILTFRNDIWRANIIYGIYDVGRMAVNALRPPRRCLPRARTKLQLLQQSKRVRPNKVVGDGGLGFGVINSVPQILEDIQVALAHSVYHVV